MSLVLLGRCVTMRDDRAPIDDGAVYVGDDGRIEAVTTASASPPSGYDSTPRVRTGGVIYPGLIDLHSHLAYNTLSLWTPPGQAPFRTDPFDTRYQWSGIEGYARDIGLPAHALGAAAGKELLKYAEMRALAGGVTAIQGSPTTNRPYEGSLVRNVEYETFGTKVRTVFQSVLPLEPDGLAPYRQHMIDGDAFLYHLAEGRSDSAKLHGEFDEMRDAKCLRPQFVGIHCTALSPAEFTTWSAAGAGSVVWSPLSNLCLYGQTTDIAGAHEAGLRLCIGADWGPSGSKSVLGELKVADLHVREHLHAANVFTRHRLVQMVTSNPADALGWSDKVGRIAPGLYADLMVTAEVDADAYDNLVLASERDVRLVLVGGSAVYGLPSLMKAALPPASAGAAPDRETIRVGGLERVVSMVVPGLKDADVTWAEVLARLAAVRKDPEQEVRSAFAFGEEPLQVIPDMPWDRELPMAVLATAAPEVVIPPLDPLTHGPSFFDALERAPIVNGALNGLRAYYTR